MINPIHHLPPRPTPPTKSYQNHSTKPYDQRQFAGRSGAGFDRRYQNPSVTPSPQQSSPQGLMSFQRGGGNGSGMTMDDGMTGGGGGSGSGTVHKDMEISLDDIDADDNHQNLPEVKPTTTTKIIRTYIPSPSLSAEVSFVQLANPITSTSDMPVAPDFRMPAPTPPLFPTDPNEPVRKPNAFYAPALPVFPLPPLPPINNDEIRRRVFTRTSLYKDQAMGPVVGVRKGGFEDPVDKPARDYGKIEHVGDSSLLLLSAFGFPAETPGSL